MLTNIFQGSTIPVLQEVIGFAQARHNVLAGNVANMDTPGYRVRDLSVDAFQQRLREAIDARTKSAEELSPGVLTNEPGDAMHRVRESTKNILFHDQSDVGLEQQVMELSKNQFMHSLAISIINSQFRLMQTAISERV